MTALDDFDNRAAAILDEVRAAGQFKQLRAISGPMGPVATIGGREIIVLCSNDYLGLANHPDVVAAGIEGLRTHGAGTASVRFICGTLDVHVRLEESVAALVGTPAALSFVSCWNANEALFPTVTAPGDTVVSDALNHASIIDAVRQTRGVERKIYAHNDLAELEAALGSADPNGLCWVVTDGVFSMEGDLAPLPDIVRLCRAHGAVVVVDDSHGIGVLGAAGRGTSEHFGVFGEVDVITGTLGKALGGAAGGFVAASERLIELLVQKARPSLFSNALPASVACSATRAIEILLDEPDRVARLRENATRLRTGLRQLGFECRDAESAIIPIILGDAHKVEAASARLYELGVLVVGFSYPVVSEGQARLRVQASAALEVRHLDAVLKAFGKL